MPLAPIKCEGHFAFGIGHFRAGRRVMVGMMRQKWETERGYVCGEAWIDRVGGPCWKFRG